MCFNEVTHFDWCCYWQLFQPYITSKDCFVFSEVKEKLQESFSNISDSFLVLQEVVFGHANNII